MAEAERDYQVGYGKPPLHTRFKKGQSGNPRGAASKHLSVLLSAALDQPVTVTSNGRRRRITKREAMIAHLVDKSAAADLHATKMLIDMMKEVERRVPSPPEVFPLSAADKEVIVNLIARLRRAELARVEDGDAPAADRPDGSAV